MDATLAAGRERAGAPNPARRGVLVACRAPAPHRRDGGARSAVAAGEGHVTPARVIRPVPRHLPGTVRCDAARRADLGSRSDLPSRRLRDRRHVARQEREERRHAALPPAGRDVRPQGARPGFSDCVDKSGHVIAYKVYTREVSQSFHATRRSPLGRALAISGMAVYTYRASGAAVAHGCKPSVQRYTYTGTVVAVDARSVAHPEALELRDRARVFVRDVVMPAEGRAPTPDTGRPMTLRQELQTRRRGPVCWRRRCHVRTGASVWTSARSPRSSRRPDTACSGLPP